MVAAGRKQKGKSSSTTKTKTKAKAASRAKTSAATKKAISSSIKPKKVAKDKGKELKPKAKKIATQTKQPKGKSSVKVAKTPANKTTGKVVGRTAAKSKAKLSSKQPSSIAFTPSEALSNLQFELQAAEIKKTKASKAAIRVSGSAEPTPPKRAKRSKAMDLVANVPPATQTGEIAPYETVVGEEYMNKNQLAHFKQLLEQWRRDLMEEVDHTITEMKEATNLADPNDRATQEETFGLELRTRDRERKLLKKIEEALQQIEDEEYGYCEACGVEIGVRRLEARPTATLCIDCKTLAEIREKRA